jgi:pantoate kinase
MAKAFAPAHVSGVFAVHDEAPDVLRKGSRGCGWSLDLGATATVRRDDRTLVRINGQVEEAPVTRRALGHLAGVDSFAVDLRLDLPTGQGFGMSAAGTLAACLAAASELGLEPERALEAAHAAEVESGTGLGDAVGSWFGCGEVRTTPGVPPHGWALRVEPPEGTRFLFCVMGQGIPTPSIIRDAAWKRRTRELGDAAVDRILAVGRDATRGLASGASMHAKWDAILWESHAFSDALGLMPEAMRSAGALLPPSCRWGQSMLGNTMWVTGPPGDLAVARRVLAKTGLLIEAGVDVSGARMVR